MSDVVGRPCGHRAVPHTADVILEAWGTDLASCTAEAVAALVELCVEVGAADDPVEQRAVHLPPGPAESLLLDALDEVIFTLDTAEAVPIRAEVTAAGDGGLDLVLVLANRRAVVPTGAVPKGVSHSELVVRSEEGAVRCRFLVDV